MTIREDLDAIRADAAGIIDRADEAIAKLPGPELAKTYHYLVNDDTAEPLLAGRRTLTPALRPEFDAQGARLAYCVYASDVGVNQSTGTYSGDVAGWINRVIPAEFDGVIMFDIEAQIKAGLHGESASVTNELALETFGRVYSDAKGARPNATVCFYGTPTPYPWKHGGDGVTQAVAALQAFQTDAWCPYLYDNALADEDSDARHATYIDWHDQMFQAARELDPEKPILPVVYERVDSHTSRGNKRVIPDWEILRDQIIFAFERGAAGVLHWGKNERVLSQGSWGSFPDCAGMSRLEAERYLRETLPRHVAQLMIDACRDWRDE